MTNNKCSLLKPVDNLTGTFFMFSQYAQDLTKQYSNSDSYRCVPSKFIAMNLDYSTIPNGSYDLENNPSDSAKVVGEIFQNYFENACTFLRAKYEEENRAWNPEYTRTLLFQTLQKYQLLQITEGVDDVSEVTNGSVSSTYGYNSGISNNIQYIGDINIYSYNNNNDGVGYNEIYCYIPNEAKCMNYQLNAAIRQSLYEYKNTSICGYENQIPYNNLSWSVSDYIDSYNGNRFYGIGEYNDGTSNKNVLIPQCLTDFTSDDQPRLIDDKPLDKFNINTIVVLYDIVSKNSDESQVTIYKNIPLGIYFTGKLNPYFEMENSITKYVDSGQIYNQGTSYGLRVCTRFFSNPNSTEIIETTTNGSSNISEMAPVLEKMGETLAAVESVFDDNDKMTKMLNEHLAQFKNNKVNVPYVRQLGNKKYWFVNGKNTGAIAQYEYSSPEDIISKVLKLVLEMVYSKEQIDNRFADYITRIEYANELSKYATKEYVEEQINKLKADLLVYLQGE
jgi:hypothetical protein